GGAKGISSERGAMRMVVLGDSLCMDNELIDSATANHYFASLAVNWLLDRPQILLQGLVPQPLQSYQLAMTKKQMRTVEWIFLGAMPGGALLLGLVVWWVRRK